jgi:Fic family protein
MGKVIKRRWIGDYTGLTRSDRRPCEYEAYLPDKLCDREFLLTGDVAGDVADAEASIATLNAQGESLVNTEALARILLRAEAVASSRIEGLDIGARRLLHAEVARGIDQFPSDFSATEVLGNIDAMVYSVQSVNVGEQITEELLLEIHRRLLVHTRLENYGGHYREVQNWIGGSSYNPCTAAFVPPPPEYVADLMDDLCVFANDDSLPVVAQAAIAHAQFETIHPFIDGNGRAGRALIHLIFRRRGLALRVLPPVSLILATWAKEYVNALNGVRFLGPSTTTEAQSAINRWIAQFADACSRAVADAGAFEKRAQEIADSWRNRVSSLRKNSAADLLIGALIGSPVVTVNSAATLIGRSYPAANNAVTQLVEAGVLAQINIGQRNRAFEAHEIIAAFSDLERRLASPHGDTRTSTPVRRVPKRR